MSDAYSDADRFPCSICGRSVVTCLGHPRHLFTPERIIHVVDEASPALRRTSNEGLLKSYAVLTHRLHVADRSPRMETLARDLRDQRDILQNEILRRMG